MDYLKLAVYLRARELVVIGNGDGRARGLCAAMHLAFGEVVGACKSDWTEFFPEFLVNCDGSSWSGYDGIATFVSSRALSKLYPKQSYYWWPRGSIAPRLRYLDMLIERLG